MRKRPARVAICAFVLGIACLWLAHQHEGRIGNVEDAKADVARTQIHALTQAVHVYRLNSGEFPARLEELTKPLKGHASLLETSSLMDPWGQPFRYDRLGPRNGGKVPDIWSDGPKGEIGNWMPAK